MIVSIEATTFKTDFRAAIIYDLWAANKRNLGDHCMQENQHGE